MGIEDYWNIIAEIFPAAVKRHSRFERQPFDHVMVDLNHVLYRLDPAASDEEAIEATTTYLDSMISLFPARKSVFVALDGPEGWQLEKLKNCIFTGPRAKFLVQRERREKTADRNPNSNSLKYTPGSEFMAKMQLAVCAWAAQRASAPSNKGIKFFVSGADREGEGEFKIYQHLMEIEKIQDFGDLARVEQTKSPASKDSVLLLGTCVHAGDTASIPKFLTLNYLLKFFSDSDLVVSGFRLQILKNIDICVMRMLSWKELQMIDLRQLHNMMLGDLPGDPLMAVDDITLLSLLSGSDYTPRLLGYSFKKALLHYRALRLSPNYAKKTLLSRVLNKDTGALDAWSINTQFFRDVIAFSDHAATTYDVIVAKVNGREKKLVLNRLDPKSILNTLAASLVKSGQIHYDCASAGLGRTDATVSLIYPSGKKLVLAKTTSASPRRAQIEAAQIALRLDGNFFTQICRKTLDSDSLESLRTYLSSIANMANALAAGEVAAAAGALEHVPDADLMVRHVKQTDKTKIASEATRPANEPALIIEFLRMLIWTLEYYQGTCRDYSDVFHFFGAPSGVSLARGLYGSLEVPIEPSSGRVLSPRTESNPKSSLIQDAKMAEVPLVPLAFFVSIMPPVSSAVKALPEPLRLPVLEFRAGEHRDMLGLMIDNVSARISLCDASDELLRGARDSISRNTEISDSMKKELNGWLGFSPSYVFFQPTSSHSDSNSLALSLDSIKQSNFAWDALKASIQSFEKSMEAKNTICLAEEDVSHAATSQRASTRLYNVINNRFMIQKRKYTTTSKQHLHRACSSFSSSSLRRIGSAKSLLARAARLWH